MAAPVRNGGEVYPVVSPDTTPLTDDDLFAMIDETEAAPPSADAPELPQMIEGEELIAMISKLAEKPELFQELLQLGMEEFDLNDDEAIKGFIRNRFDIFERAGIASDKLSAEVLNSPELIEATRQELLQKNQMMAQYDMTGEAPQQIQELFSQFETKEAPDLSGVSDGEVDALLDKVIPLLAPEVLNQFLEHPDKEAILKEACVQNIPIEQVVNGINFTCQLKEASNGNATCPIQ